MEKPHNMVFATQCISRDRVKIREREVENEKKDLSYSLANFNWSRETITNPSVFCDSYMVIMCRILYRGVVVSLGHYAISHYPSSKKTKKKTQRFGLTILLNYV